MKFDVILADPPWDFEVWNKDTGSGRSPSAHYNTLTLDEICSLTVSEVTEKNCALFLWSVWPRIFDAKAVIDAWGFTYKTIAWVWVKQNKRSLTPSYGMGYYTRANTEPCLLAVKGRMPVAARDVLSVIIQPRMAHSSKPLEQYLKIDRLYPDTNRLELFARSKFPGWKSWGNEIPVHGSWSKHLSFRS